MLDIKFVRENIDLVVKAAESKGERIDADTFLRLDEERRKLIIASDELKHRRNVVSEEIGLAKKKGQERSDQIAEMREVSQRIKELDTQIKELEEEIEKLLLSFPNIPDPSVPFGYGSEDNVEIKSWGEIVEPDFLPKPHWELAERLNILDLDRASKITGSGFTLFKGVGAKLQRALISFMLDLHTKKHNYTEILPPFIVNRQAMIGTGQLPKMEEDMYLCEKDDLFLIPTAEVPLTNIFRDEIIPEDRLPIFYTAYTPCFRREAGSYGRDTRGLIRVHQFDKVELVKFVHPDTSADELETLLQNAEEVLQMLKLPYRVMTLSTGDLSFAAAKCYDIEVWAMGIGKYLEVSSCSNFRDFQTRRANIRFRCKDGSGMKYIHTLNGSGVALPRTMIAILENYQCEDGTIVIPEVLKEYMDGLEKIE